MTRQSLFRFGILILALGMALQLALLITLEPLRSGHAWWMVLGWLVGAAAIAPLWHATRDRNTPPEQLERERREFEASCQEATLELERQAELIGKRERRLAEKFLQYESWMEYPLELDESDEDDLSVDRATEMKADDSMPSSGSVEEQSDDFRRKDREVAALLEKEAEVFFERIKSNEYSDEGKFQWEPLRDDLMELMTRVARIYHPDAENPLMETSVELLLRAGSRTCLHLLVLLERLPLNIANYNLRELYGYLRKAFRAYQVYQSVKPFVPYAQYASYAGRIALGGNPITLGAQWAIWTLGKKGAAAATKHIVNRQALTFLHDSLAIVTYEVAGIYGGEVRHRSKHWVLGVELAEVLSAFPLSRDSLVRAFAEIGSLPLRSEYDRVFLFRCISGHRSAGPNRFRPKDHLESADRQWIAGRLEQFVSRHVSHRDSQALQQWAEDCSARLGVSIQTDKASDSQSDREQIVTAGVTLVSYAVFDRQLDVDELDARLSGLAIFKALDEAKRQELIDAVRREPPSSVELPDLDPDSKWLTTLMTDMATLLAQTVSRAGASFEVIEWFVEFFRIDEKAASRLIDRAFQTVLESRFAGQGTAPKLDATEACALLELLPEDAAIHCAYTRATIASTKNAQDTEATHQDGLMLAGWDDTLALFDLRMSGQKVWTANEDTQVEVDRKLLTATAELTAGDWEREEFAGARIVVSRTAATGQDAFFEPLRNAVERFRSSRQT